MKSNIEYDEIPELTDADLARGTWKIAGKVVSPSEGKAAFSAALREAMRAKSIEETLRRVIREELHAV